MSALSALKQITSDGSLAYYYAQKGIRIMPLRRLAAATVAAFARQRTRLLPAPAPGTVAATITRDLQQTGFAAMPTKSLDAATVARVVDQLRPCILTDWYGSDATWTLDKLPPDLLKARYRNEDVIACRTLTDLINDPDILAAVTQHLGAPPTIAAAEAWWTFGEQNQDGRKAFDDIYHRDVDDLRFVKLFLYLTDTTVTSGAHRFLLGSHADDNFTSRRPISDDEVDGAYQPEQFKTVTGTAGTTFLEDTWGIHRAMMATTGRRLVFSAIYVLAAKVPFGPSKPALPLPEGYDRYTNRLLFY